MNRTHTIVALIVTLTLGGYLLVRLLKQAEAPTEIACPMDARICPDGTTVGRTGPACEFAPCPERVADEVRAQIDAKKDLIVLESPTPGSVVSSLLTLTGKARGYWYFEASFPIIVVDWDGRIIGEGYATAQDEWMTTDFVPFVATVSFELPPDTPYRRGAIILKKDNPSGLPEHDDALEVPVRF